MELLLATAAVVLAVGGIQGHTTIPSHWTGQQVLPSLAKQTSRALGNAVRGLHHRLASASAST